MRLLFMCNDYYNGVTVNTTRPRFLRAKGFGGHKSGTKIYLRNLAQRTKLVFHG